MQSSRPTSGCTASADIPKGLQVVPVHARVGWIVLASDAAHLYANMTETRPFPMVFDVGDTVEGYRRLRELAHSPDLIVPGHDPLVMRRYAPPRAALRGSRCAWTGGRSRKPRARVA
jgi:glyoxylase-like metal-dependent hydrolase (beta-lactamase superfamily II)